ncbi:Down syndrome cell adhesion molecule-like protein 1 [Chamberlinius hualienensis]
MRAHVSCAISEGDLPVTFQWLKDQEIIGPNLGIVIRNYDAQTQSLSIENVGSTHSGNYTCVVRNKAGTASHTAVLYVRGEGHLVGSPARLVCGLIEGDPPVSFQWLKDGLPIRDNMTSSSLISIHQIDGLSSILTIGQLVAEHTGSITCIASNSAGSTNYTVQIKVNAPKIVPFAFQGDHVFEGALARLTCVVYQGDLPLKINWMKDGITIPTDLGASIHQIDTYTSILTIDHVELKHGGNYTCIAQNRAAATSHTASLVVNVSRGDLPIQMRWEKDGSAIVSGSLDGMQIKSFDDHSSILSIVSVKTLHNGRYSCIASNEAGTATNDAVLAVKVPPRWLVMPTHVASIRGSSISLHCQAEGYPKPTITWIRREDNEMLNPLKNDHNIKIFSNGTLYIAQSLPSTSGSYYCQVSNGIGMDLSHLVKINVYVPPKFKITEQTMRVRKSEDITIQCLCEGDEPLTLEWLKETNLLLSSQKYKIIRVNNSNEVVFDLTIVNATRMDNGTYYCVANNKHGSEKATIELLVLERPDQPINVQTVGQSGREITLKWDTPFSGNLPIDNYIIQYYKSIDKRPTKNLKMISGRYTTGNITELLPATSYEIAVYAENSEGKSEGSKETTVSTNEEAPSGSPRNIQIESVNHEIVKVLWKPPEESTWNGRLLGYNIGFKEIDFSELYSFKTLLTADPTSNDLSVQIGGMKQHTRYAVVVQAYNNKGKGPLSEPVMMMTSEEKPKESPTELRCTTLTSTSIHVTWTAPPAEAINGILKGYKLIYKSSTDWFGV